MTALLVSLCLSTPPAVTLGLELEAAGKETEALEALERAALADPSSAIAHIETARLLLKRGSAVERALRHAETARSLAPENPRAHYLLALALDESQRRDEALKSLAVAVSLRPSYSEARFRLASMLAAQERWVEAASEWSQYVEQVPEALGARLQWAESLERSGDLKSAERELRSLIRFEPMRPVALRRLVLLLERRGASREATQLRRTFEPRTKPLRPLKPSAR